MEVPETRYASVGDAEVAYQVLGEGPPDLLLFSGLGNIEMQWTSGTGAELRRRLAAFTRVIMFDPRGVGISERVPMTALRTCEEWTDDMIAVLDAAGSERAAIVGAHDAGPAAILFAALHPERVRNLILMSATARFSLAEDYSIGVSPETIAGLVDFFRSTWGTPEFIRAIAGTAADDDEFVRVSSQWLRAMATPKGVAEHFRYVFEEVDVRPALPLVQAPTLVLHSRGNPIVPISHAEYLRDHIGGARLIENVLDGTLPAYQDMDSFVDEVIEFVTGTRPPAHLDRVLTTVLFTDIVGSTERAAGLGDRAWRRLLDAHDRAVREALQRFRGQEIKTLGDGVVASFDGPARAIRCAQAIVEATSSLGIDVRAGLHTGECDVRGGDLSGLAVHIAARVGALANGGQVLVSGTVKDLVIGSGINFADRGEHDLKGVPGTWRLFAVEG